MKCCFYEYKRFIVSKKYTTTSYKGVVFKRDMHSLKCETDYLFFV